MAPARVLLAGHDVVVLDEPTAILDADTAALVLDTVLDRCAEPTTILLGHGPCPTAPTGAQAIGYVAERTLATTKVMQDADNGMICAGRLLNDVAIPAKKSAIAKNRVVWTYPSASLPASSLSVATSSAAASAAFGSANRSLRYSSSSNNFVGSCPPRSAPSIRR